MSTDQPGQINDAGQEYSALDGGMEWRLAERISEAAKILGTRKDAAAVMGISADQLQRYIARKNMPSMDTMFRLATAAGVSLDWLCGLDVKADYQPVNDSRADEFSYIPRLDIEASLGPGTAVAEEVEVGRFAFRNDWLSGRGLLSKNLKIIGSRGDSMSNTIFDGDLLLVDASCTTYQGDGVYVILVDGEIIAKRIQSDLSGGFFIKSDNPTYSEIHVDNNNGLNIKIVAKVEKVIRVFSP